MSSEYLVMPIDGKDYNLCVEFLPAFREKFGLGVNGIDEPEFIAWCKESNIKLVKIIETKVVVDINEYLRDE